MLIFDTICALSTPPYKSALAVVRLSGKKSLEILSNIIKKDVKEIEPNKAYFAKLYKDKNNPDTLIDEAVITFYKGPKSYTGFDSVDFSTHGNMIVVEELLDTLTFYGARRAEKGEFSAQAYFNGKMDLLKAEGVNDLINASSKRAKQIAAGTLSGQNTKIMSELKKTLLEYMSRLEYFVENTYDEEQLDDYTPELDNIAILLSQNKNALDKIIEKTKLSNKQYSGFNVAIAGEPNVGKSTLLNALLKEEKAIVSPIPGTTRDVVEGEMEINGILFRFKDTAGLRKTDDYVENLGIERSFKTIEQSDIVLLASDNGFSDIDKNEELWASIDKKPFIKIATKKDINEKVDDCDIALCSTKDDLHPLLNLILKKLNLDQKQESSFLGKREEDFLVRISDHIQMTIMAIQETHQVDIVSDTLRLAISDINELMGNNQGQTMEDIYQTLFSKFCLGK